MKAKLIIESVEVVKGVIYDDWMVRYSASGASKSADPKSLKIHGRVEGIGEVIFFTPTVVLVKSFTSNMEIHHVYNENNWFISSSVEDKSNKVDGLPIYFRSSIKLSPAVSHGDAVNISFSVKGMFGKKTGLNRVKLLA